MTKKNKVAFGTSSVRTVPMTRTHEDLFPGPAHYTNTDKKAKQDVQLSSTFASLTDRLHSPPPIVKVKTLFTRAKAIRWELEDRYLRWPHLIPV